MTETVESYDVKQPERWREPVLVWPIPLGEEEKDVRACVIGDQSVSSETEK